MKKLIMIMTIISLMISSNIQSQEKNEIEELRNNLHQNHTSPKYQLFPTQNMWTFIKLNTQNGHMWQVQFDVEGSNRFVSELNLINLANDEKKQNGRFTLHPTDNIYTFILLDQIDGRVWQTQWSLKIENRGVMIIE